jgi:hypothetical protein
VGNSNLRVFWIIWCVGWACFWLLVGFFTFLLGWIFVPFSLLAILIPIGVNRGPGNQAGWYPQQTSMGGPLPPAGWYPDPYGGGPDPRWWDGANWR